MEARAVNSQGTTKNGEKYQTIAFIIDRFEFAGTKKQTTGTNSEIPDEELEKQLEEFFEEDKTGVITAETELPF